ncbi:hypothetical protein NDU88_003371 [Pleurodeles waltl]|uniref:Uncharacterized protein n=1 Tax=Pleurodeles waltl TaxID=8319 RepID=A0AAV7W4U2_PLEWA|nr:hypothetical protein NDU88_003371 [Pleurodeles waltl]
MPSLAPPPHSSHSAVSRWGRTAQAPLGGEPRPLILLARARDPLFQRPRASRKPPGGARLTPSPPRDAASPSELGETALALQQRLRRRQPGFFVGPRRSLRIRHPSRPPSWLLPP